MHVYLETDRLLLRRFTADDEDNLVELDSDPQVMRFLTGGRPTPREVIAAEVLPRIFGFYERFTDLGLWAAIEKSTGQFIGWFHLRPPYEPDERACATPPSSAGGPGEPGTGRAKAPNLTGDNATEDNATEDNATGDNATGDPSTGHTAGAGGTGFPTAGGNTAADVAELGYRLRRSAWGKGYATEGSRALIRKGFTELGIRLVIAHTMTVNTASRRVMEKAGLSLRRTFHRSWPDAIEGAEHGDVEYALDRAGWRGDD